jgi:REP element-mobilizing transposase RayT
MADPLAYFLTWTTYGTWLPGDQRGWVDKHTAGPVTPINQPDSAREAAARTRMTDPPVILDPDARRAVDAAIRETCRFRGWFVHALNVRSNHVHAVVCSGDQSPGRTLGVLKAYGSRALNAFCPHVKRERWWTEDGSKRYINEQKSLNAAIEYVLHQDDKCTE